MLVSHECLIFLVIQVFPVEMYEAQFFREFRSIGVDWQGDQI